jgi:hypothetical protein
MSVRAVFFIETRGEQFLELTLPPNAQIRALAVNQTPVTPKIRRDGVTLIELAAGGVGKPFPVDLVYSQPLTENGEMSALGALSLEGPRLPATVPVNKTEVDLFVPKNYSYWSFGGTLHPRTSAYSNTLAWLTGGDDRSVAGYGHQFRMPDQPLGQFPTEGRVLRFETLAPVAVLSFSYCGNKLVVFLDVLLAALVVVVGVVLIRVVKLSRLWVGLGLVLIPLLLMWYVSGDAEEPWAVAAIGGGLLAAALLLITLKQRWHDWREMRIRTAPDPFLEEAPEKPTPAENDREAEGQKDRKAEEQRDREAEGQKDRKAEGQKDREAEEQKDREAEGQKDSDQKSDPSDKPRRKKD